MDNGLTLELATELDNEIKAHIEKSGGVDAEPLNTAHALIKIDTLVFEAELIVQDKTAVKAKVMHIAVLACRLLQSL